MEFFKQWTFCVCITLITAVIFSLFAPRGKMKSFYKSLISLFIFISFLYPFKDFRANNIQFDVPSVTIEEQQNKSYESVVNSQIEKVLNENGITGASISSDIYADYSSGELTLNGVQIAVSDEYDLENIKKIIFDSLGINARVIYIGE